MTRDDILRMAREAQTAMLAQGRGVSVWNDGAYVGEVQEFCERFAALIAAAERDSILKMSAENWYKTQADYDAAIRARGEK